jgi:hypothetical protein
MTQYVVAKGFSSSRQFFNGMTGNTIVYTSSSANAEKFWGEYDAREKAEALEKVTGNSHEIVELDENELI